MNSIPTLDAEAKARLKAALIDHARAVLADMSAATDDMRSAAREDAAEGSGDGAISVDDQSQADEAGDLSGLYDQARARAQDALTELETLDFAVTDSVGPGAVVVLDGDPYVVGAQFDNVEVDGTWYDGISLDAPIYPHIAGRQAGETFEFNGRASRVDLVC